MEKAINLQKQLFSLADGDYKNFHAKLIPSVTPDTIIGIRTPVLRKFANEFYKTGEWESFLNTLPHKYYEENNLHAFLLEKITDYDELIKRTFEFLPYIDNWATCDMMKPKIFKKHTAELLGDIDKMLASDSVYAVRYGINCLMTYYLDNEFKAEYFDKVINTKSDEYYINMMRAWYFATALAKQYDSAVKVIENRLLDEWTHNKTIQKSIESYRVSAEHKAYLKTLKY